MLYPKIGIRPTIDGRWGGIRESLEAQTMGLAQAAQTLSLIHILRDRNHIPQKPQGGCVIYNHIFR